MVLFGYGLLGLSRRYLEAVPTALKKSASLFEKRWAIGSIAAFALSLLCPIFDTPIRTAAERRDNLTRYVDRMTQKYG